MCGIAQYLYSLETSVRALDPSVEMGTIGVREQGATYEFPPTVLGEIRQGDQGSYTLAAALANESAYDVINLQHEFGLYTPVHGKKLELGEDDGQDILEFLRNVQKPVVTTLHMVFPNPPKHHKRVVQEIVERSAYVVTIVDYAAYLLLRDYEVDERKIRVIPHGVPNIQLEPTTAFKQRLGIPEDQLVISTFGLIRAKKGIEYAIRAMPQIIQEFPNAHYYVVGAPHPQRPKEYIDFLQQEAASLGVADHVHFVTRFLEYSELLDWLRASNVFLAPFLVLEAISSGTLIYAMGAGRACVATPFVFAKEVLADNRGILIPPRSKTAIAKAVKQYFRYPRFRHTVQRRAYQYAHARIWEKTGKKYLDLFTKATAQLPIAVEAPALVEL